MEKLTRYRAIVTPVSGAVTWNTEHLHGDLVSIHIKPATDTTEYVLRITDPDGLEVYETIPAKTGECAESYDMEAINEILTCALTGATKDEAFTITIRIREYQLK